MSPISRTWRQVREIGDITANHRQRSEEHTSELQSRLHLVCRLLLEKKKKARIRIVAATAISFAAPLFSVALTALLLKEHLPVYRSCDVLLHCPGLLVLSEQTTDTP